MVAMMHGLFTCGNGPLFGHNWIVRMSFTPTLYFLFWRLPLEVGNINYIAPFPFSKVLLALFWILGTPVSLLMRSVNQSRGGHSSFGSPESFFFPSFGSPAFLFLFFSKGNFIYGLAAFCVKPLHFHGKEVFNSVCLFL